MTASDYIDRVVSRIPPGMPLRRQVAMELRSLIAERLERGQSVEQALLQLGDPDVLAESYLSATPLVNATFWPRVGAKVIDWFVIGVGVWMLIMAAALIFAAFYIVAGDPRSADGMSPAIGIGMVGLILGFIVITPAYFVITEYYTGQTLGKRLVGLRVVRESGSRISFGQSVVRQLPQILSIWWIDVIFALFTEKRQRAFEMLSKTRCVRV